MIGILLIIFLGLAVLTIDEHIAKELRMIIGLSAILVGLVIWQHISFSNSHIKQKEVNREGSRNIIG